ncbi:MAG: hypothetical protein ACXVOI_09075, partial [Tumebacillaceae bacterium]
MAKFRKYFCAIIFSVFLSILVAGCGSSTRRTLYIIASGTPTVGVLDISGSGALTLDTTNSFSAGSNPT